MRSNGHAAGEGQEAISYFSRTQTNTMSGASARYIPPDIEGQD
jgi:hypothetical protein